VFRDPRAVDPLIEALAFTSAVTSDDQTGRRVSAARALGEIGDPRAIDPLTYRSLNDENERVRTAAAEALEKIGAEPEGEGEITD
jgi:HEAT repeat protein